MDAAADEGIDGSWVTALAAFEQHLTVELGRSPATVRAYRTDLAGLAEHARRMRRTSLADLDLGVLRSWLAAQRSRGVSSATLGRRASAARSPRAALRSHGALSYPIARVGNPRPFRVDPSS